MKPTEKIEKLLKTMTVTPAPQKDRQMLNAILQAQAESKQQPSAPPGPSKWRIVMHSKLTKPIAAAAAIIIAVLIGINQFGIPIDGAAPAFAAVLNNINMTGGVVYKEKSETPEFTFNNVEMVNEDGIIRSELEDGSVLIIDTANRINLCLDASTKKAKRLGNPSTAKKTKRFCYINWLRKLSEGDAKFIGREDLNKKVTNVYVWEVPFEKITVWVDPEVNLPVKVEHKNFANKEKNVVMPQLSLSMGDFGGDKNISAGGAISSGRSSGFGITENTTRTMYDFQWDVKLDESLFSLEPPEGYALEQKYEEDSTIDDNSLIHILGFWARMNNGQFPTEEQLNDPNSFKPIIIEEYNKNGNPEEEFDQARLEVSRVLKGIYVVQEKKVEGHWGYLGQNVSLGQSDAIVCWWFDKDTNGYKAIFGDLSFKDVTQDQLPLQP